MIGVLWFALLLLASTPVPAPAHLGDGLIVGTQSPTSTLDRRDLTVADDPDGTLTFDQVRAEPRRFSPVLPGQRARPLPHRYWMRLDVISTYEHETRLALVADRWDVTDFYVVHPDGDVTTLRSGMRRPIDDPANTMREPRPFDVMPEAQRDGASSFATVWIHPGEHLIVFAHVATSNYLLEPAFALQVARFDDFLERGRFRLSFDGVVIGVLFGLAIYSLTLGVSTRERSYVWFGIYLIAIGTSLAGLLGPGTSNLMRFVFPHHPLAAIFIKRISDSSAWIALILFTRDFYQTRLRLPLWDRVLLVTGAAIAIDAIVYLTGHEANVTQSAWLVAVLFCLATGIAMYLRGTRSPYFIVGQLVVLFGLAESTAVQFGRDIAWFLPDAGFAAYFKGSTSVFVASVCNALVFSLGLNERFRRVALEQRALLEATVAEQTAELRAERDTSEQLLHNILPPSVAEELKRDGTARTSRFEDVSIMFTDFKDFTTIAASMPAPKLVSELDEIFRAFDDIVAEHGLEKIKTIGDSYMAAAGLPGACADHAERCVRAALAMTAFIGRRNVDTAIKWEMRAGIHSGSVIAGVVGKRKFTYDVWGDTVNIASRVENGGDSGRVSVSAYTYDLIKKHFACTYRGKVPLKGKGEVDLYVVDG